MICQYKEGAITDLIPAPYSARTKAHEYGGLCYAINSNQLFFCESSDQQIYQLDTTNNSTPNIITTSKNCCYADFIIDTKQNRIISIREEHHPEKEATSSIVSIDISTGVENILASGSDFYSNPKLSPCGEKLSWLCWNHPNMPWDENELWLADIDTKGNLHKEQCIAGRHNESLFQPQWSPSGDLYVVSDKSNWWNIYRYQDKALKSIYSHPAEFATPQWIFGMSTYQFDKTNNIHCCFTQNGLWQLGRIGSDNTLKPVATEYTDISSLTALDNHTAFIGCKPNQWPEVVITDSQGKCNTIKQANPTVPSKEDIAIPEPIHYPTSNNDTAYGFYYPPTHKEYIPLTNEQPPLIVLTHGGPTGAASTGFNPKVQYWTNRGFAVVDINYRGSTGFGREYREKLKGKWGIVDVEDCIAAANHLVAGGKADPERLIIKGSSAGGYTVLSALTFHDTFKAGASYYGISDLEILARDTHKFEARYLDKLIAPYPEGKAIYQARSPLYSSEKLQCPVIFLQGLADKVVPPNQAEAMVSALQKNNVPVAHITFEQEGHGFRQPENIKAAFESELYFYSQIFDFEIADHINPINIKGL